MGWLPLLGWDYDVRHSAHRRCGHCVHNVCGSSRGSQNCNSIELRVHQGAQRLLENLLLFATGAAAFVHWYSVTVRCAIATMAVVTERCGEGCHHNVFLSSVFIFYFPLSRVYWQWDGQYYRDFYIHQKYFKSNYGQFQQLQLHGSSMQLKRITNQNHHLECNAIPADCNAKRYVT